MSPGRAAWLLVPLAALAAACAPEPPTSLQGEAEAPGVPRDLAASPGGSGQVALEWQPPAADSPGVASYRLYRDSQVVAEPDGTSHEDTGLEPSTTYRYEVSAVNGEGLEGDRAGPVAATTEDEREDEDDGDEEADDTPPGEPSNLQAETDGPSSVDLTWEAASDAESGISGYRIYRDGERIARTSETSFGDTELEPSTTYRYEVSAVNGEGLEGDRAGPVSATTEDEEDEEDDTPPDEPSDLEAEADGSSSVDLEWEAASDAESGISGYRIYRDDEPIAETSGTSYEDTGLEPSTTYRYEVSAVNGEGLEGDRAGPVSATTEEDVDDTPPDRPSDLKGKATDPEEVELKWKEATDPESGIDHYRVYRDHEVIDEVSSTEYDDDDVEEDERYKYHVTAVNGAGLESEKSKPVHVETPDDDDDDDDDEGGGDG